MCRGGLEGKDNESKDKKGWNVQKLKCGSGLQSQVALWARPGGHPDVACGWALCPSDLKLYFRSNV